MKACLSCGEQSPESALYCAFCGAPFEKKKVRWYFRTSSLVVAFLFIGPLILPAVWVNPHYSFQKKLFVTALVIGVTFLLTAGFVKAIQYITQYYGLVLSP